MSKQEIDVKKAIDRIWTRYVRDRSEGWIRFMHDELRYTPDPKLVPVIHDLEAHRDTALKSSHGVGKTCNGACVLLTALTLTPKLIGLQLSPTWRQVKNIFWNEMRKWAGNSSLLPRMFEMQRKAPEMRSILAPQEWFAVGLASDMPGTLEGFHGKRVFLLCDETKAIKNQMIQALEGALTSEDPNDDRALDAWRAYYSTPTNPGGDYTEFYDAFNRNAKAFKRYTITAYESPRVSKAWVKSMIAKYGKTSPIVQAKIFGEFPNVSDDILIPLNVAETFFVDTEREWTGGTAIGVDVARFGMDETVVTVANNNRLREINVYSGIDTQETARLAWAKAKQLDAHIIVVDDIGLGGGVTDRLMALNDEQEKGDVLIYPFSSSEKPDDGDTYKNKGDEVWTAFAEDVTEGRFQSEVEDEGLLYQLASYKRDYTVSNQIKVLWPKRSKRSSDSNSPDRADSTVLSWYGLKQITGARNIDIDPEEETDDISLEFAGILEEPL